MTIINPFTRCYPLSSKFFVLYNMFSNDQKTFPLKIERLPMENLLEIKSSQDIFDHILSDPRIKTTFFSNWVSPSRDYINPDYRNLVACHLRARGHMMIVSNKRGMANVYIMSEDVYDIIKKQISPPTGQENYSKKGMRFVGYYDRGELMFVAEDSLLPKETCMIFYSVNYNQIHESPFFIFYKDKKIFYKEARNIDKNIEIIKIDISEEEFYKKRNIGQKILSFLKGVQNV